MQITLIVLLIWTLLATAWWVLATGLVWTAARRCQPAPRPADTRRLSLFKPLPSPMSDRELDALIPCLESFVADLDDACELIVGVHALDENRLRPRLDALRQRHPTADVQLVVRTAQTPAAQHANPKVAWMQILTRHATGELWLWSDADIVAAPGTIRGLREDLATAGVRFVTSPYVVREVPRVENLLDALFVNLEMYPGALLLDRLGQVRFGFGSGMLFEAERFRERVDWDFLGTCLAEDFHLGQRLAPAALASRPVSTIPAGLGWRHAVVHYLRWQKTIRWCRPSGFASQVVVMPLLGWLFWAGWQPGVAAGSGLGGTLLIEALAALAICRAVGCRVRAGRAWAIPVWSVARVLTWVACWLPWPVVWRGDRWWSPFRRVPPAAAVTGPENQPSPD